MTQQEKDWIYTASCPYYCALCMLMVARRGGERAAYEIRRGRYCMDCGFKDGHAGDCDRRLRVLCFAPAPQQGCGFESRAWGEF